MAGFGGPPRLAVQLGVIEPTLPAKNKPVLIIKTKTFPKKQIGELRASLHSYVQKHINVDDPKPNWEQVRLEAEKRYYEASILERAADHMDTTRHESHDLAPAATLGAALPPSSDAQAGLGPHQSLVPQLTQGEFLESFRKRLGWGKGKLADRSDLDYNTIKRAESNKCVDDSTIEKLVETFNAQPEIVPKIEFLQVPRIPSPRKPRKLKLPKES
jgi:hypothetical protein